MQDIKCPNCGHLNPDIRELGYKLPFTCGRCPHIWRLQDLMPLTRSQKLWLAGFKRRKTAKSLPSDE
jgi:hypothetical protein